MNTYAELSSAKSYDAIQQRLVSYASRLTYEQLPSEVVHAAKVRIIDVIGAIIAGFHGEPCAIVRDLAREMASRRGATIIGTKLKTTLDMAAFVNGTTARYPELTDSYHFPGSYGGHAGDTIAPLISVGEHVHANGKNMITATVLGYEVFLRVSDAFRNDNFHHTTICCLSSAMAAGKLMGLDADRLGHCISMAILPNAILKQVRSADFSITMFKAAGSGQAGRAGVFAAMLARAGMDGPHLPFVGKTGWCDVVAGARFALDAMGGTDTTFKILDTQIKTRASAGFVIPCILAAEKIAKLVNAQDIRQVSVEVYRKAASTDQRHWNPPTKEDADHSVPYVVAAALMDGTVTPKSYDRAHLASPELRGLMQKITVIENKSYTDAYPHEHRARVTVETVSGVRFTGETGGDADDISMPRSDMQIEAKFRGLTEALLGTRKVNRVLDGLWHLEDVPDVAEIPRRLVLGRDNSVRAPHSKRAGVTV